MIFNTTLTRIFHTARIFVRAVFNSVFNKNICILVLIFSAAYLTGLLWFERISSNRNFFYTLAEVVRPAPVLPAGSELPFVEPKRIVTGFANRSYTVDYLTEGSPAAHPSFAALRSAIDQADYTGTSALDWPTLLSSASFLLDYPFRVPSVLIDGAWNTRAAAITRYVPGFCAIVIAPGITSADGTTVTFVDSAQTKAHHFRLDDETLRAMLRTEIINAQSQTATISYSASSEVADRMFRGNAFIPVFSGDLYYYTPLRLFNPYAMESGYVRISSILPLISAYFQAPAAIVSKANPGEYIFSDEHTIVRFCHNNILEYSNYRTTRQTRDLTPAEAYAVARDFIRGDTSLGGRVYLTDFAQEYGSFVFSFGLATQGFPVKLPGTLRQQHGLAAHAQVTVRGGIVSNYVKWAMALTTSPGHRRIASLGFFGAYDNILDTRAAAGQPTITAPYVNRASLVFYPDPTSSDPVELAWYLRLDGISYVVPTTTR